MDGTHRVLLMGTPLRFFLSFGEDGTWAPVTDVEFHRAYQESMFDPDALRSNVLCPNRHRAEYETVEGWCWSDGRAAYGLMTLDDRVPQACVGLRALAHGSGAAA
ncbi:hypothetical protein AAHZ94_22810 [Streptomyces sp. HSW2009]|uniref:hypothetical protein n=1 Tax=Streptomyces sp. HSW2009 TaxID=3142890 RepID=UPI0032EEBAD6